MQSVFHIEVFIIQWKNAVESVKSFQALNKIFMNLAHANISWQLTC